MPCYILDREGRIRWLNGAAEELVGDVTGSLFTSVVDENDLELVLSVPAGRIGSTI